MTRKYPPSVAAGTAPQQAAPQTPRRFARAVVDLPAQYVIEGQTEWHTSTIDDLGGGGVRLQTSEDVAAGTTLSLRFEVSGSPVSATARVAMSLFDKTRDRFVHGVAFTAIDPEDQKIIVSRVVALQTADEA